MSKLFLILCFSQQRFFSLHVCPQKCSQPNQLLRRKKSQKQTKEIEPCRTEPNFGYAIKNLEAAWKQSP
jgi:hypothetical protein